MKCECFSYVTDLVDYLNNNLIIAYYCGIDITKKLPGYHAFERFIKDFNNALLKKLMASQVQKLYELGVVDASFIAIVSTPISANTNQNNPKSFVKDKFNPKNHPNNDPDCKLGVHTASNQHNEKKYEFSGAIRAMLLWIASADCPFIDDKAYDIKKIYNTVKNIYDGDCVIPLNPRNKKNPKMTAVGNIVCEAGFAMHKDGKDSSGGRCRQKYCCPFKNSKGNSACICAHKNYFNGKKNRGCVKYITLPDDYRLSIDRSCISFKKIYAMRSEIERYNARFKKMGQERMWVRSFNAVQKLSTLTHVALLAAAAVLTLTQRPSLKLSLKSSMRSA